MESFGWISLLESLPLASRVSPSSLSLPLSPRLNRVPSRQGGREGEEDQEELFPPNCRKDGRSRFPKEGNRYRRGRPPLFHSEIQSSSPLFSPVRPPVPEDLAGYRQRFELSGREYSLSSLDALITPIKYSNTLQCIIHRSASFSSPCLSRWKIFRNGDEEKGERTGIFASNNRDLSSTRYPS